MIMQSLRFYKLQKMYLFIQFTFTYITFMGELTCANDLVHNSFLTPHVVSANYLKGVKFL